jgi:hypothetical protein
MWTCFFFIFFEEMWTCLGRPGYGPSHCKHPISGGPRQDTPMFAQVTVGYIDIYFNAGLDVDQEKIAVPFCNMNFPANII